MLKTKESSVRLHFASALQDRPSREVPTKHSSQMIFSVTFLPFTHTIYTLITRKSKRGYLERKTLNKFSTTQHTHLLERELLILNEKSLQSLLPSLSHCHTLRGDLYPNTIHTFSECRECFGAWKALGICQKKPMRLGECNQAYCRIWKVSEDKTSRSPLVTEAWRAQVHWIDQIWRVFCYSCTLTYSLVDRFRLGGSRRGFSLSSSISSSITHLSILLCLHLYSLLFKLFFYCSLWLNMAQSSVTSLLRIFTLIPHFDKLE